MDKPKRIFIIHGWDQNPHSGWYPWLKKELEQRKFEATVVDMPYDQKPDISTWTSHLFQTIIGPDKKTYLIGHDIGATTVLRFLEKMPSDMKIGGVILVAPMIEAVGQAETDNFFEETINFGKAKQHAKKFIGIYSNDDPLVPLKQSEMLKKKLDASIIVQEGMKHFSAETGVTQVQGILNSILEITK